MASRQIFRALACLVAVAIVTLSLVSPSLRPVTRIPHNLEHAGIFVILGFVLALGFPRRIVLGLAAMIVFAGAVELAQRFAPGRHARLIDFVVDAAAACIGVGAAALALHLRASVRN